MHILDRDGIEFSLEKLVNCSLLDAYRVLNCKRKISSHNEKVFLIPKYKLNVFKKYNFYLQKVSLPQTSKVPIDDEIFLIENVVAEFCNNINRIDEQDWWLYAACHSSGNLRIISGIGKGIALSRFLPSNSGESNENEIAKTIMYLQRFGMEKNIKIFSPLNMTDLKISPKIMHEKIRLKKCSNMDRVIADFLSDNNGITPIITNENFFEKFLSNKLLCAVMFAISLILLEIYNCVEDNKEEIRDLKKNVLVKTRDMELKINHENFQIVKRLFDVLENSHNPIALLRRTSDLCREHDIRIEQLSFENSNNQIRIKTSLDRISLDKLKSIPYMEVEKVLNDEYEELESNKKLGAVICIKQP
ncbi:MAG: hypothetical protein LBF54_00800 [Holosporaceae bacterium]|jgi:hypothetical protein|nr:hypothetical protein [Holosporaceae bacterium]